MTLHTKTLLSRGRTGNTFHDTEKNKNENTENETQIPYWVAKPSQNPDDLLEHLNSHHPTIVFTVEKNPDHFLDTSFTYVNKFTCKVYKKPGKLPTHWKSEIPTKWKRNCVIGVLYRVKRISSAFDNDAETIETIFLSTGYPKRFISHTVISFLKDPPVVGAVMAATFLVALTFMVFFTCPAISGATYADESQCFKHNAYSCVIREGIGIFCAFGFYARVPVRLKLSLHGFHKSRLPRCLWATHGYTCMLVRS